MISIEFYPLYFRTEHGTAAIKQECESMLELKHVSYQVSESNQQIDILQDVSFSIPEEKFVVITGPNGGGNPPLPV